MDEIDPSDSTERDAALSGEDVAASLNRAREILSKSESVLSEGGAAIARFDAFAEEHDIQPGVGRAALAGERAHPARKQVFESLFFELDHLENRIKEIADESANSDSKPSIGARAVGNRYRI